MKIPTIKKTNKEFMDKFEDYWDITHPDGETILAFYQDKMLKMLEYLEGERKEIDNMKFLGSKEDQIGVQRDMGYNQAVKELKEKIGKVKGS